MTTTDNSKVEPSPKEPNPLAVFFSVVVGELRRRLTPEEFGELKKEFVNAEKDIRGN